MLRTFNHKTPANKGKLSKVLDLFVAYPAAAQAIAYAQWRLLFESGRFNKNAKISVKSGLSARYLQTCQYQVVGQLTSFIANRSNDFKDAVMRSSISGDIKLQLLYLSKYQLWYAKSASIKGMPIPAETLRLARNIMRHILKVHRKPDLSKINLVLDEKVAVIESAHPGSSFPYWLKLSTLDKGRPVALPIQANPYYESKAGTRKAIVQLNLSETLTVGLVKDIKPSPYVPALDSLGLDVGLRTLISTSEGDLIGRDFGSKLAKWDMQICRLAAQRQRLGLPVKSRRYLALVKRMRSFIKNEIHRTLRHVILMRKPHELVVEQLDFRSPDLSRRMNRLIQNFGRACFQSAIAGYAEQYGFTIVEVNPAYTSQSCSSCAFTDKNNRHGDRFKCKACGNTMHADVNAAKNIQARRSDLCLSGRYVKRSTILAELNTRSRERILKRHYSLPRLTGLTGSFDLCAQKLNEFHDLL